MCTGRIPKSFILQAFLEGADGVFIGGCHIGDCHYLEGNHDMLQRYNELKDILESVGINSDRYHLEWISASEGKRFSQVVTKFVNQVKELGPLPKTGDKIEKKEKAKEGA
jgi:F420-non-reducing hydrogenase iron-sulfur subunit